MDEIYSRVVVPDMNDRILVILALLHFLTEYGQLVERTNDPEVANLVSRAVDILGELKHSQSERFVRIPSDKEITAALGKLLSGE